MDAGRPQVSRRGAVLLDRVVASLLGPPRQPPTAALVATAVVLREGTWRSYRAGRAKVATQAAIYLNWLVPPADLNLKTTVEVGGRTLFVFETPGAGGFADLLVPDASGVDSTDLDVVAGAFEQLAGTEGFAGVRLLFVSAPMSSMIAVSPSRRVRLAGSQWWFEAAS